MLQPRKISELNVSTKKNKICKGKENASCKATLLDTTVADYATPGKTESAERRCSGKCFANLIKS